jgi:uncharacterized protein (TIGR00251 family)
LTLDAFEIEDGTMISVKARAGARANQIRGIQDGALRVDVTQAAEKGKANKAIVGLLAKQLGIPKSNINVVTGQTHTLKKIRIDGLSLTEFKTRMDKSLKR